MLLKLKEVTTLSSELVWGLFPRLLGCIYLIALASLFYQIVPLAGLGGIHPIQPQLQKIAVDYPGWRRLVYFPTLLWLNSDDRTLRLLVVLGMCGAMWSILGGPWSILGLALCWSCFLSLDRAAGLVYPWDCLLLEAGFLAMLLPSPNALPELSASSLPLPAVEWAFRWLLFRVVFGFGKLKFFGLHRRDYGYLKGFFVAVPLPTPLGWYAHHLPGWTHKLGLACLFLAEVVMPFFIFVPGDARLLAALTITGLMLAIQLTGNYGYFNLLVIVLCVPLLDMEIEEAPLWSGLFWPWSHLLVNVVVLILMVGGLLYLPSNSWCSQAWLYWPSLWQYRAPGLRWLFALYRLLAPFRLLHAYGVFPPASGPSARAVPVIEGTLDGKVWKEYSYRFLMTSPTSAPVWVAPHHPRLDHSLFYEASGTDVSNFLASTFAIGNPYLFSRSSGMERLVQRLLEGNTAVLQLFGKNPFPDGPPLAIRVSLYMLRPTSCEERARTGAWWQRQYLGPHLPPVTLDPEVWNEWLPEPELFHWDELIWKLRAPRLKTLFEMAKSAAAPEALLIDPDLDLFWSLVAEVQPDERRDWRELPRVVARIRARFPREKLRVCERILGRLSLVLLARLLPFYLGDRSPRVEVLTFFHLGLLISHIIASGKETYEEVARNPEQAASMVSAFTLETGLFLTAVFWLEKLAYHARKFRMVRRYYALEYVPPLPGFVALVPFLAEQFEMLGEEHYPIFVRSVRDGEWLWLEEEKE